MRRLFVPAGVLLLFCQAVLAQAQEPELQLTASIAEQTTCMVSPTIDALRLSVQLRYTNTGKRKLILYKGNRLFFQTFISRGGAETAAHRNELRTTHSRFFDEEPEKIVASAPGGVFTTISPGASYETRQLVSIPVARSGEAMFNVSIPAGEHVLNVATSTWYESKQLGDELRERWRTRGYLWTDPLISNAVAFVVDKNRATTACH